MYSSIEPIRIQLLKMSFPLFINTLLICHFTYPSYYFFSMVGVLCTLILSVRKAYFIANLFLGVFLLTTSMSALYFSYGITLSLVYAFGSRLCVGSIQKSIFSFFISIESMAIILSSFMAIEMKYIYELLLLYCSFQFIILLFIRDIPIDSLKKRQGKFLPEVYKKLKRVFGTYTSEVFISDEYKTIIEIAHCKHIDNYKYFMFSWFHIWLPLIIKDTISRNLILIVGFLPLKKSYISNGVLLIGLLIDIPLISIVASSMCKWDGPYSWRKNFMVLGVLYKVMLMWAVYSILY